MQYARYLACREVSFTRLKLVRDAFFEAVLGSMQAPVPAHDGSANGTPAAGGSGAKGSSVAAAASGGSVSQEEPSDSTSRSWQPTGGLARILGYFAFDRIGVVVETAIRVAGGSDSPMLVERPAAADGSRDGAAAAASSGAGTGAASSKPGLVAPEQTKLVPLGAAHYARALAILPGVPTELIIALQRERSLA